MCPHFRKKILRILSHYKDIHYNINIGRSIKKSKTKDEYESKAKTDVLNSNNLRNNSLSKFLYFFKFIFHTSIFFAGIYLFSL